MRFFDPFQDQSIKIGELYSADTDWYKNTGEFAVKQSKVREYIQDNNIEGARYVTVSGTRFVRFPSSVFKYVGSSERSSHETSG